MIKKEYETLVGKKVPWKDKGLQKYMGEKKPYYSFTEAHHFKGVKDHPFDTESSFRYANRRQGNIQNSIIMENCEINSPGKIKDSIISNNSKIIQSDKPTGDKIFLLGEGTKIYL